MRVTKEEHLVSVIVPVYNVEKYLRCCLDSIITQSYPYLEIICVNDGSTDSCGKILEEYKKKDERIIVITQENKGLSCARNTGIDNASGNYIMFVDSDDFIEVNMVEVMLKNLLTYDSDFVIESVWAFDEKTQGRVEKEDIYFTLARFGPEFNGRAFSYKEILPFLFAVPVMAWAKLYKTEFLKKTGVRFPEGLIYEDNLFFFEIFSKAERISIDRRQLYNYRVNVPTSIMKKSGKHYADMLEIMRRIENVLKQQSFWEEIKQAFMIYRIIHTVKTILNVSEKYERKYFYAMQKEFLNMEMLYCVEAELSQKTGYELFCCIRNDKFWQYKLKKFWYSLKSKK